MEQMSFFPEVEKEEYDAFTEKFKSKLTTDDCYTPPAVYDAVAGWVEKEYGVSRENFVRPFYPGGDYTRETYLPGQIVVDNPPFSILAEIKETYQRRGVPYFLFAPTLTLFSSPRIRACHIAVGVAVTYENGAEVNTSFVTNLEDSQVRSAPDLYEIVRKANEEQRAKKQQPKYEYPPELITATKVAWFSKAGVIYAAARADTAHVRALDAQRDKGKAIFGAGYLLSARATAERLAAERWELSEREREICRRLGTEE